VRTSLPVNDSPLRFLPWVRAGLAVTALVLSYFYPPAATSVSHVLIALFCVYTVVVAIRAPAMSGTLGLLALFADTVFFVILGSFAGGGLIGVAAAFFLYLLTEGLVYYGALELFMVCGVCAVFCIVLPSGPLRALLPTVLVAGALACGFAVSRQKQKRRTESLNEKLAEAQKAAQKAGEAERQRIASDFHDGPLQSFISLQMRLEILRKLLDRDFEAGMEDLKQLQSLAQTQIRDLRAFVHSMRPVDVDGANLVATARRTAETFQKESGIPVTFMGTNTPVGLPQEMSLEVLQMLRESLHNVQKHAGATRVAVFMEKTDRGLEISVDDNGHGFNFAGTYSLEELELLRLGPASLKRRARSLSADLLLESRPGRGSGLKFRIPLQ
jgi:signal transduction histidine kinase